jgi:hypothetical protein
MAPFYREDEANNDSDSVSTDVDVVEDDTFPGLDWPGDVGSDASSASSTSSALALDIPRGRGYHQQLLFPCHTLHRLIATILWSHGLPTFQT